MELLIVSFVAGVLTILAPCILPLLPVIIGGTATEQKDLRAPFIIAASLAASLIIFSLLLKASTALLGVPPTVWQAISGGIIIAFGVVMLFPSLWERVAARLNIASSGLLAKASKKRGVWRHILVGAALGPVFSSCSPTYALIVAAVLPVSFAQGFTYLTAYAVGLSAILLLIGLLGQQFVSKLGWASNPHGWFKRIIGVIFIVVGMAVLLGLDKQFQAFILQSGLYDPLAEFEQSLMH
jgi:cytochrome c biogenesis protein CcdA